MNQRSGHNWTRDEVIAALSLYCQIPFGKMHSGNPDIKLLAQKLERTNSSIALKLVNFASLDPDHSNRGVSGMGHVSVLDRQVWEEFYGMWDLLAVAETKNDIQTQTAPDSDTEITTMVIQRRGQTFFRRSVLAAYSLKCCVTGIASPELLRASHIVPWATDSSCRLDPCNGLALNALHDTAFDRGLMTLDKNLQVVFSGQLATCIPSHIYEQFFEQFAGKRIHTPERFLPKEEYLTHHRKNIFLNN